jgi:hypothetical protein
VFKPKHRSILAVLPHLTKPKQKRDYEEGGFTFRPAATEEFSVILSILRHTNSGIGILYQFIVEDLSYIP